MTRNGQYDRFQSHAECLEQAECRASQLRAHQRISRFGRLLGADVWLSRRFRYRVSGYQRAGLNLRFRFADQWLEGAALQATLIPSRDTSRSPCHSRPESPYTEPTNSGGGADERCRMRLPSWREDWRETSTLLSGGPEPEGCRRFVYMYPGVCT